MTRRQRNRACQLIRLKTKLTFVNRSLGKHVRLRTQETLAVASTIEEPVELRLQSLMCKQWPASFAGTLR